MIKLKNNYQDDVLDSEKNQLRKYNMIQNDDGTVSFVDATVYSQNGDNFGAKDINDIVARIGEVSNNFEDVQTQINNIGEIVVDEQLSVTIVSRTTTPIKAVKNLSKGVYITTFRAIGLPQEFIIGTIKKNNEELSVDCSFSTDQYMSAQSSVSTIFTIENATDEVKFELMSSANLENRAGQTIKIMRIA